MKQTVANKRYSKCGVFELCSRDRFAKLRVRCLEFFQSYEVD